MEVQLEHNTPLYIAAQAIRQCWQSQAKSDTTEEVINLLGLDEEGEYSRSYSTTEVTCGPNDKDLIDRIGNKSKHASTLEHLSYNFTITGVSRALLQELSRHRISSLSVKSTRYTLKELKKEVTLKQSEMFEPEYDLYTSDNWAIASKYLVSTGEYCVDLASTKALYELQSILQAGISNDKAKYCLPESYKTDLAWTVNARSLQNFLTLRSNKAALWEIQDLAQAIFNALPEEHKYLFEHCLALKEPSHE